MTFSIDLATVSFKWQSNFQFILFFKFYLTFTETISSYFSSLLFISINSITVLLINQYWILNFIHPFNKYRPSDCQLNLDEIVLASGDIKVRKQAANKNHTQTLFHIHKMGEMDKLYGRHGSAGIVTHHWGSRIWYNTGKHIGIV